MTHLSDRVAAVAAATCAGSFGLRRRAGPVFDLCDADRGLLACRGRLGACRDCAGCGCGAAARAI